MAKKGQKHSRRSNHLFSSHRRKHNPAPMDHDRHHHHRRHNPFDLPIQLHEWPAAVGGAVAGGVASSWLTNMVLGSKDQSWLGYLGNGTVAIGGAALLSRWKTLSLGWLLGGLTMTFGRMFDDFFGKQVVTFQSPLGSYYRNTNYVLPAPVTNDLVNATAAVPALPVATVAAGNAALAKAKMAGMGWNPRFTSSRFAA